MAADRLVVTSPESVQILLVLPGPSGSVFQADIHLQQEKECVLTRVADTFETTFDISIEEFHKNNVTFIIEFEDAGNEIYEFLDSDTQVKHVERLDEENLLVTKTSCGGYSAIDRNHGIVHRENFITPNQRVYTVLFFRREDLRATIREFKSIGTVTLGRLTRYNQSAARLTSRQREVVEHALDSGYFEWPRAVTSEELAEELGISRTTLLEHLRKAESKLLEDALQTGTNHDGYDAVTR